MPYRVVDWATKIATVAIVVLLYVYVGLDNAPLLTLQIFVFCGAFAIAAFALGMFEIFFVVPQEGTAVAIMTGRGFNHFIMKYRAHAFNDPRKFRRRWFDASNEPWEVIPTDPNNPPPEYAFFVWRLLARHLGVYWYGLWPFKSVYEYTFDWTERRLRREGATAVYEPWHRTESTRFIYIAAFVYWIQLKGAEDENNIPIDLDYTLSVTVNNPYKALFTIDNWLGRLTSDANQAAKVYVGNNAFEEIVKEKSAETAVPATAGITTPTATSQFVTQIMSLNHDLPTAAETLGAGKVYGATVTAAALQEVTPPPEVAAPLRARIIATKQAQADVERAKGQARSLNITTTADANRIKRLAQARAEAVTVEYDAINGQPNGVQIRQLQAVETAANGEGSTVIVANDMLAPIAGRFMQGQQPPRRPRGTPPAGTPPAST